MKKITLILAICLAVFTAKPQAKFYLSESAFQPWGMNSNIVAMNQAFGVGAWTQAYYPSVNVNALLQPTVCVIFMEGGDSHATALNNFLITNLVAIQNWVFAGGRLFINAAPNVGGNINYGFGGVLLNYAFGPYSSTATNAVGQGGHPIYTTPFLPAGTAYTGNFWCHGYVTGPGITGLTIGTTPGFNCAQKPWGAGLAMFGSMTLPGWHLPNPNSANYLANLLTYLNVCCIIPTITAVANPSVICVGFPSTLTAGGAGVNGTYTWTPGPINGSVVVVSPTATTIYTVTGTTSLGCIGTRTVQLNVNPSPTITATPNPTAICLGFSSTVTLTGANTYTTNVGNLNGTPIVLSPTVTTTYTTTGTSSLGCVSTKTFQIIVNPLPVVTPTNNGPICSGGILNLGVGVATSYSWTGPGGFVSNLQNPTIANATATNAGVYTVSVTNANGCVGSGTTLVVVNPVPVITPTNTGPYCVGANILLQVGANNTYTWTGPNGFVSTLQNPVIFPAQLVNGGVYTVSVTAIGGCISTGTTMVVVNPTPTITATPNPTAICINTSATVTLSGANTYTTNVGNLNGTPIVLSPTVTTTYTTTGTSTAGCVGTRTFQIVVNPLPVIAVNNPLVCLNQPINLTANGGATYNWTGPLGYTSNVQNPVIPNAQLNMSGGYTVVVTTALGCTASAVANVTVITLPQPTITSSSPNCVGSTLTFTGGGGATYSWSGPNGFVSGLQNPSIPNVQMAANGIYTLIVTAGTCSNVIIASVTINPLPTPTAISNSPVCLLRPINFTGLGGTTYTWTGPGGFLSNAQNPVIAVAQNSNAGVYTLSVTNANGCVSFTTTTVIVNPLPVIVVNNPFVCLNQAINLTSNGGVTYNWNGPLGYTSNVQNPVILNAQLNMSGGYTVNVTTAQGCTANAVANVTVITLPNPVILSTSPNCVGSTLSFTGSGGATYSWSGPNGFASLVQNPSIPNVQMAANGIYTLLVTAGTCSNVTTASVTINPLPTPTAISNSPVCLLQPINFTGNGGTTYTWTGPGGFLSNAQNPVIAVAQNSNAGVYTLSVTNANGCVNFTTTNVIINPLPVIVTNTQIVCLNQQISLASSGGVTYSWTGPLGYTSNLQNPVILNAQLNMSGAYTVNVTTALGCTANAVANVTVITLPQPTITSSSPNCVGSNLTFTGSGGVTYNWSGPNGFASLIQNPNISNVQMAANGIYTLIVTAGTCSNVTTASVTINPLPTPTIVTNSPVCLLQPIIFSGSGGTTYTWTGPGGFNQPVQNPTIAVAQNTNGGTYTLTVTNANGCVNNTTSFVQINPLPVIAVNNPTTCVNTNINLTANGGTAFAWTGQLGFTSNLQNPVIPGAQINMSGAYTVTVTSALGCTNQAVAMVSVIALPQPTANSNGPKCVGQSLTLIGAGGTTYSWSGPNGFFSLAQNPVLSNVQMAANGTYSLVATVNTCTNLTTVNVVINPLPNPIALSNSPVCLLQPIVFTGNGGVTYTWTGPGGFNQAVQNPTIAVAQNTNGGNYVLTVTDANTCTNSISTSVTINQLPSTSANGAVACQNTPINLTAFGALNYAWSGPSGFTSNLQNPTIPIANMSNAGQYTVIGTSAAGCTAAAVANVTVIALPQPTITASDVCVGATLNLIANGGTGYTWNGPNGFTSNSSNPNIPNVTLAVTGVYTLVASVGMCNGVITKSITINPLPNPILTSNSPICLKEIIQLNGSGGSTYQWVGPNGFQTSGINITINNAGLMHAGIYTATATDMNGCVNTATIGISINQLPSIGVTGSTLCATKTISLAVAGALSYVWTGPAGFTSTQASPQIPDASTLMTGDYTVVATNVNSCKSTSVVNVHVNPEPQVQVSSNSPVCTNNTINLFANSPTGVHYFWDGPNDVASSPLQNPKLPGANQNAAGVYTLYVTDNIGCLGTAFVNVIVRKLPEVNITSDKLNGCVPICINFNSQSTSSLVSTMWEFGDGSMASGVTAQRCFNESGNYEITNRFTDNFGCSNSAKYNIEAYPIPIADFNHEPSKPIINETVTFTDASWNANVVSWTWSFSHLKNNTIITKPEVSMIYPDAGNYVAVLIVSSDHGCKDTAIKAITVGDDFGIYVPDAFSPNGDGVNDVFQPKGFGIVKYEMNIFDRWGERLFTTSDFETGWDGTFPRRGNEEVKQDVYVWKIKITNVFGKSKELAGKVSIIK